VVLVVYAFIGFETEKTITIIERERESFHEGKWGFAGLSVGQPGT